MQSLLTGEPLTVGQKYFTSVNAFSSGAETIKRWIVEEALISKVRVISERSREEG